MAGTTAWSKLSDEIAKGNESKFKEKIISLLRILNPSFEECQDIPGVDFAVWSNDSELSWAVQCQVFDIEHDLNESHAFKIIDTTQAFINKNLSCNKYWVIHNHQNGRKGSGKFTRFLDEIEKYKNNLENKIYIDNFLILQRQEFLDKAEKKFRNMLTELLRVYSDRYRLDIEEKLQFGKYYVSNIPAEESEIIFKKYNPIPSIEPILTSPNRNISEIIISERKDIRWTLIHGEAGAGKTTTSLHNAIMQSKVVFFINCDILDFQSLHLGTNFLLEHILRTLNVLEEVNDERDKELLYLLSGATLAKSLEHSEEHVLIFDGLDENRFYSDPCSGGLKLLSDRLSGINCPIILVTRTSHFEESLFSELGALVNLTGTKGESKVRKKARALKLPVWSKVHILQLIETILEDSETKNLLDRTSLQRLHKFKNIFLDESYKNFYGELPLNPLFLQFILSDVIERDIQKVNRATLIYQWVRQKIHRDLEKDNRSFPVNKNVSVNELLGLIDKILYTMELVSKNMTMVSDDGTFKLKDFTDYKEIEDVAAKVFSIEKMQVIDLLLNSVLTSHITLSREKYRSTRQRITFIFKILQEYFLACYLVRENKDTAGYPSNIQQLCQEIIKTEHEEDLWLYISNSFSGSDPDTPLIKTENPTDNNTYIQIHTREVNFMSTDQTPSVNISGGTIKNAYFAPHHGDNIDTVNNYFGADESIEREIVELKKFISELEVKHPGLQSEADAEEVLDAEIISVQASNPTRWETLRQQMSILRQQLLNPERHLQATKATVVEVARAAFDKSLIAKAVITYADKLSEEPNHGV